MKLYRPGDPSKELPQAYESFQGKNFSPSERATLTAALVAEVALHDLVEATARRLTFIGGRLETEVDLEQGRATQLLRPWYLPRQLYDPIPHLPSRFPGNFVWIDLAHESRSEVSEDRASYTFDTTITARTSEDIRHARLGKFVCPRLSLNTDSSLAIWSFASPQYARHFLGDADHIGEVRNDLSALLRRFVELVPEPADPTRIEEA